MTQFWMSVVWDEQLQQLGAQLCEAEAQLKTLRGSLKIMPPIMQVTKEADMKVLQK